MHTRFKQYLAVRGLSQRGLSRMAGVGASTVSRLCLGEPILTDSFLRILSVCRDLSLEWLFYGCGDMFSSGNAGTGAVTGPSKESVVVNNSHGVNVSGNLSDRTLLEVLAHRDRTITERDRVITELDEAILHLHDLLSRMEEG